MTLDLFSHLTDFNICSFGSGSSGNSYYIGNADTAILVDAGINGRNIVRNLEDIGKNIRQISGILVTHDHIDHIKGLPDLSQRFGIKIYTTSKTWGAILQNRFTKHVRLSCFNEITSLKEFVIGTLNITAFPVEHDAADPHGFHIESKGKKLSLATDLGCINNESLPYLSQSHVLILESNYDETMLAAGPYPPYLKARIAGNIGHLSNQQAADFLVEQLGNGLKHVFLAHLSEHNNTPEKAIQTLEKTLITKSTDPSSTAFHYHAFDRKKRSRLIQISLDSISF